MFHVYRDAMSDCNTAVSLLVTELSFLPHNVWAISHSFRYFYTLHTKIYLPSYKMSNKQKSVCSCLIFRSNWALRSSEIFIPHFKYHSSQGAARVFFGTTKKIPPHSKYTEAQGEAFFFRITIFFFKFQLTYSDHFFCSKTLCIYWLGSGQHGFCQTRELNRQQFG